MLYVPKKDGDIRIVFDYRMLNAVTRKDSYPLPLIQDILASLSGATIFITVDLSSGFFNIIVDEDSRDYTAFNCHVGQFRCKRTPMGLCNEPAAMQRLAQLILNSIVDFSMGYLDDLICFSSGLDKHIFDHLPLFFEAIRNRHVKIKPSKVQLALDKINFLGFTISGEGIRVDENKICKIRDLARPTDVKSAQ